MANAAYKVRDNMSDIGKLVRCNHCMAIVSESELIVDESTDSGERCPICYKSDALMDMENEEQPKKG